MCVVAAGVGAAAAGGIASSATGALLGGSGGGGGGGGGGGSSASSQSLGQDLTGILGGGLAAGLGISGLAGGNLNQLQAGAAAANPFGQYASEFYGPLYSMLAGSGNLDIQSWTNQANEQNYLNSLKPSATISTNTGALNGAATIGTPGATNALTNLMNNPSSATPASIQNIINQNPYSFTQGEQFQYQQGLGALQTTQAAQGLTGSGAQMIQLEQYGQNYASQATQQNIQNLLGAQSAANQSLSTQVGTASTLGNLLSQQQQNTFGNLLGTQQLQSSQQQNTQQNLSNLLTQMTGINSQSVQLQEGLLPALLTASQASLSSPATAGGILSNLGAANQQSAGNLASGIGGLTNGIGNLLSGINFGSDSATGSFSGGDFTGAFTSNPYYSGGGNSFGFVGVKS